MIFVAKARQYQPARLSDNKLNRKGKELGRRKGR